LVTYTSAELALCDREQRFRSVFDQAAIGMAITEANGRLIDVNPAFCRITGYDAQELATVDFPSLVHPEDRLGRELLMERLLAGEIRSFVIEKRLLKKGQGVVWVRDSVSLASDPGHTQRIAILIEDITERKISEEAAAQLSALVEFSEDAIVGINLAGCITSWNRGAEKLLGFPALEALGMPVQNIFPRSHSPQEILDLIQRAGQKGVHRVEEAYLVRRARDAVPVSLTVSPIRSSNGQISGAFMIARDIGDRQRAEHQLAHMARHDTLTGLPNRLMLAHRLEAAIARADESALMVGVIYVDLDGFKFVNDALGHEAGDLLLQQVTERFSSRVRQVDTLARMGGDEFVLIVTQISDPQKAMSVAERMAGALTQPFVVLARRLYVTASMGISIYPLNGMDASALRRAADAAMYEAKLGGKDRIRFFNAETRAAFVEHLELESDLRGALDRGELSVNYQPIFRVSDLRPMAFEALLRWFHPARGLVSPVRFIPVAEETGLIVALGRWVLEQACRECSAWQERGLQSVSVAVNVSPVQFARSDFVETVQAILDRTGLRSGLLELELTESMMMRDIEDSIRKMSALRDRGVRISADDFGTGYSSLGYLHRLPLDTLKIDRSFVTGLGVNSAAARLITGMISLAQAIGKRVIVEGVETPQQLDILRQAGCDEVQGWLLGAPALAPTNMKSHLRALSEALAGSGVEMPSFHPEAEV
jgi:diguanylate cyclase (GGDEF)-like protein/PAS domain S-box-containing protein